MPLWLFGFIAALSIAAALGVVLQRNPVHCLLALVLTLLTIAVLFIGLDAVTVGFLQAIVYAGAIMVLFLFVIWLLNLQSEVRTQPGHLGLKLCAALGAAILAGELFTFLGSAPSAVRPDNVLAGYGSIDSLAAMLFSDYLISFEVTSVLLLAAVVGAVAIARRLPRAPTVAVRPADSERPEAPRMTGTGGA